LQTAHDQGAIHCDLKPANIMVVTPGSSQETIKVMDFGLSRLAAEPYFSIEKIKGSGLNVANGTPEYTCPEQVRGEEIDQRGDLYSVGVILYELLSGRLPFTGTMADVLQAQADKIPPMFADVGAGWIAAAVEAVVRQCLNKYPRERPQSAHE